jgi:ATP-dependent exoDNAse (exonuclease V) beta subunit
VANPFRFGSGSGAEFGSAMHTLFEQLEWAESEPLDRVVARWRTARPYPESLARAVEEQFRTAMARSEFAAPLRRPLAASVTLWRERAFDILMDGRWVTGTFDRVVVCGDAWGTPTQVTVLDFKSDRVDGEAGVARAVAQYSAQVGLYRQALAQAFAVDSARVMAQLLFTVPGRCVTVS